MVDATVVWALLVLSLEPTSSGLQFGLKPTKIPDKETSIQKTAKFKHSSYLLNMPMKVYSIYFTNEVYNLNHLQKCTVSSLYLILVPPAFQQLFLGSHYNSN